MASASKPVRSVGSDQRFRALMTGSRSIVPQGPSPTAQRTRHSCDHPAASPPTLDEHAREPDECSLACVTSAASPARNPESDQAAVTVGAATVTCALQRMHFSGLPRAGCLYDGYEASGEMGGTGATGRNPSSQMLMKTFGAIPALSAASMGAVDPYASRIATDLVKQLLPIKK
jgi:hypothetical protein